VDLFTWRALIFPVYALPAWWFAGVCLDALLGRRRLHWVPALLALLFFGFCAVMTVMFSLQNRLEDSFDIWIGLGSVLWTGLFALAPVAWWRQRRVVLAAPAASLS
jgi:hypothetical protein